LTLSGSPEQLIKGRVQCASGPFFVFLGRATQRLQIEVALTQIGDCKRRDHSYNPQIASYF
jgi:hypothetical protein